MAESSGGKTGNRVSNAAAGAGGCFGGCGVFILIIIAITAVIVVFAMHSNTGASTSITGPGDGKTAEDLMRERIIGSAIIAVGGAIVGAIVGFVFSSVLGVHDKATGTRRPANAAELIANGYSDKPMNVSAAPAYQPRERDDSGSRRRSMFALIAFVIIGALIGGGYGLAGVVVNAHALASGPVGAQVGRPEVTTTYKSDDDSSWYECTLNFTATEGAEAGKVFRFNVGNCVGTNEDQPDPDARLVHDLASVDGDKLLLEYYDAFIWPMYVGIKADPAYS